jgi:hypothetical protein
LASFMFSAWSVRNYPSMAFYLAPSRIWELMLGAILALGEFPPAPLWLAETLSLLGLALLGIAVFGFSPSTPIPGENALLPCLGAALLIYANSACDTFVARGLSLALAGLCLCPLWFDRAALIGRDLCVDRAFRRFSGPVLALRRTTVPEPTVVAAPGRYCSRGHGHRSQSAGRWRAGRGERIASAIFATGATRPGGG